MTLTSQIVAVNKMLRGAGFRSTSTLSGSLPREVSAAQAILDEETTALQARGWLFNTEKAVKYSPDPVTGEITLATTVISVDGSKTRRENVGLDLLQRGQVLFDRAGGTRVFTKAVYLDVTKRLDWDELPEYFKAYVMVRSARIFADTFVGTNTKHHYKLADETQAKKECLRQDTKNRDTRIQNLPAVDNRTAPLDQGIRH